MTANIFNNSDLPGAFYEAVTPSDSVDLTNVSRGIYVGVTGDVTVISPAAPLGNGSTVTFTGVPAGTILPIRATRVKATATTATNMVSIA